MNQPDVLVINCPSCRQFLLYGDKHCRFCQQVIDENYAEESAASRAVLTQAVSSANVICSFRKLLYLLLALVAIGFFKGPPGLMITGLVISILNLIGPIKWFKKYARTGSREADLLTAKRNIRIELYLWLTTIGVTLVAITIRLL